MNILGIETSCDETAAAVVRDGKDILSNIVASQSDIHTKFGGVVPEVAARNHIEVILPVIETALTEAKIGWDQVDGIAVTNGPGLLGSLLIGTLSAAILAEIKAKPLFSINHVEAHMYANFIDSQTPDFPILALIVSGGHTQIVLFKSHLEYEVLGQTVDDAAGEAFDKVAKMLGLGYPGGPAIAFAATRGDANAYDFPIPKLSHPLDFSFSGLKTAVLRAAQQTAGLKMSALSTEIPAGLNEQQKSDIAASFQKTVVDILIRKLVTAYENYKPESVVIAGGVAANQLLRKSLSERFPIKITYAAMNLMTDNAAMIAALGFHYSRANRITPPSELVTDSSLSM